MCATVGRLFRPQGRPIIIEAQLITGVLRVIILRFGSPDRDVRIAGMSRRRSGAAAAIFLL